MAEKGHEEPHVYDAVLLLSFGGPEGPDDVLPFLENVTRGRGVPRERLEVVAGQYALFGGVSPINSQNRALIESLRAELTRCGHALPVYFGNRNWHPLLADTLGEMADDGVRRALAFVTSAYSSYSGCRQYREDIERARAAVGPRAPRIDKLRAYWNHPGFIEPMAAELAGVMKAVPPAARETTRVVFTAHSLPESMASTCDYALQLEDTAALVAAAAGVDRWDRVYQSRSGPPTHPWLEPDIVDHIEALHGEGVEHVVVVPSGFISDHMEVVYDLDTQARTRAEELGMQFTRVGTVGTAAPFVAMIRELIEERTCAGVSPRWLGPLGPRSSECAVECCPAPRRPAPPKEESER